MSRSADWALFITAPLPSAKDINKILLLLRDYEFGEGDGSDDCIALLTSKEFAASPVAPSIVPVAEVSRTNDFELASLSKLNAFVVEHAEMLEAAGLSSTIYLVIDSAGLENDTCMIMEREWDEATEETSRTAFKAARLPCPEMHEMMANLRVSNMDFEEFVDEEAGVQEDGTYRWQALEASNEEASKRYYERKKEVDAKRVRATEDARKNGWIN